MNVEVTLLPKLSYILKVRTWSINYSSSTDIQQNPINKNFALSPSPELTFPGDMVAVEAEKKVRLAELNLRWQRSGRLIMKLNWLRRVRTCCIVKSRLSFFYLNLQWVGSRTRYQSMCHIHWPSTRLDDERSITFVVARRWRIILLVTPDLLSDSQFKP